MGVQTNRDAIQQRFRSQSELTTAECELFIKGLLYKDVQFVQEGQSAQDVPVDLQSLLKLYKVAEDRGLPVPCRLEYMRFRGRNMDPLVLVQAIHQCSTFESPSSQI